jgi:4-hydroxybenzoate polyprenyltransferase
MPTGARGRGILRGLVRLTRYDEHLLFVITTTLLGARAGGASLDWRLVLVLVANWLAVGFAFMLNDVEDAGDDAQDPRKASRNPVAAGLVTARAGRAAALIVALLAGLAYVPLGPVPALLGCATLGLGLLYSWRRVRLKAIPGVDLVAHGLLLAGLQFLCAARVFDPGGARPWIGPFAFVVALSMYGQLFNELRDLEVDRRTGIGHTVARIGVPAARAMMAALLLLGATTVLYAIAAGTVPAWVVGVIVVLTAACLARPAAGIGRGGSGDLLGPLHAPLNVVGAVTMVVWVVGERIAR